jgi:hypothetical protein
MSGEVVQAVADTDHVVYKLELRKSQKEDSIGVLQRLRIKPTCKSRLSNPLCRMRALPLVQPISEVEVQRLECEFVMGYREGDRVLYVSAFNDVPVDLPFPLALWPLEVLSSNRPPQNLTPSSRRIRILHISPGICSSSGKTIIVSLLGGDTSITTTPMTRVGISR